MSTNDVTGDRLVSKVPTYEYRANYAKIFGPKPKASTWEPEMEKCPYCGIQTADPCDAPPPDVCEQAANVFYGDPTK